MKYRAFNVIATALLSFSILFADIAQAKEPQIGFAHRVNDAAVIPYALDQGAIGIEIDVCHDVDDWWVSHNDSDVCRTSSTETVDQWFGRLKTELDNNPVYRNRLVMIWVDIKDPAISNLAQVVRSVQNAGLPDDLRIIYDLTAFNENGKYGFENIYKKLNWNEAISFCLGRSCGSDHVAAKIAELYDFYRDHGFKRGGFNSGDSFNIDKSVLTEANRYRSISDPYRFKFVHTWTNREPNTIADYMNPASSHYTNGQIIGSFLEEWRTTFGPIIERFDSWVSFFDSQRKAVKGDNLFNLNGGDVFGKAVAVGDFNGDGFSDVAIGKPGEEDNKGAVEIDYGSPGGPTDRLATITSSSTRESWTQNSTGVFGTGEVGDDFGASLAVGDFNNDGYSDLAIGVPGEGIGDISNTGAVHVLFGTASGLTSDNEQFWYQDQTDMLDDSEAGDNFAASLTSGDFNGDGYFDLAIGVPGEDIVRDGVLHKDAGMVNVLYGTISGLSAENNQLWYQDAENIEGTSELNDSFGASLTSGDFNDDGYSDLAIGAPGEAIGTRLAAGLVNLIYGTANGLTSLGNQIWHQDATNIIGDSEAGDNFGASLTSGDFNRDGYSDLAIGVPGEDVEKPGYVDGVLLSAHWPYHDVGMVNVLYGTQLGISHENNQEWLQDSLGIDIESTVYDNFGASLDSGDYNGDGFSDLAIGVPGDSDGLNRYYGMVNILYGSAAADGLSEANYEVWHQDLPNVFGVPEPLDNFGASLASGDFNGDGASDLIIGVPGEATGTSFLNDGLVQYIYGVPVSDTTPPVFAPLSDSQIEADGPLGTVFHYDVSVTDAVAPNPVLECSPASGSTFPLGVTTVRCDATDVRGNQSSAAFQVQVVDTTPPVFAPLSDRQIEADGPLGTAFDYEVIATDAVDPNPVLQCSHASGSIFPLGDTTVRCDATDASGNQSSVAFQVQVVDTTPPTISVPLDIDVTAPDNNGAVVGYATSALDRVDGIVATVCLPPSGLLFPIGTTVVSCQSTDNAGNSAAATFAVNVAGPVAQPVVAPGDLYARVKSTNVQLVWSHTGAEVYDVYRSTTQGGDYVLIGATSSTYSTYLDTIDPSGGTYYYVVRARIGTAQSTDSNEVSATASTRRRR